jgi:hypothetical protein
MRIIQPWITTEKNVTQVRQNLSKNLVELRLLLKRQIVYSNWCDYNTYC